MKATQARKLSLAVLVFSVGLFVSTLTLPHVRMPQTVQQTVAPSSTTTGYRIFGFGVPPVSQGSEFNVTLSGYSPRSLVYTLSPTVGNQLLTALALGQVGNQPSLSFGAVAAQTYSLELMIIAYNGTGFMVNYSGVWSPFDALDVYTAPSIFLIMASLAATYYFGTRIPKQLREEAVERELAKDRHNRTGSAP